MKRPQDTRDPRTLTTPQLRAVCAGLTGAGRTVRAVAMAELERRNAFA